jgi:hypothetical protein
MGIEFIRNASGKPYTKRWARGIDRIKAPTLMDVSISEESRTLTAKLTAKGAACQGATVLVQSKGSELVVFDGLRQVASITNAPLCGPPLMRNRAWLRPSSSASGSSERLRRSS